MISLTTHKDFGLKVYELPTNLYVMGSSLTGGIHEIGGIGVKEFVVLKQIILTTNQGSVWLVGFRFAFWINGKINYLVESYGV